MHTNCFSLSSNLVKIAKAIAADASSGKIVAVNLEENEGYTMDDVRRFYEEAQKTQDYDGTLWDYFDEITGKNGACETIEDYEHRISEEIKEMQSGDSIDRYDGKRISKEDFPNWSLPYLINGDSSGLSEEDKKMCDEWYNSNHPLYIETTDDEDAFNKYPLFGKPCDTTACLFMTEYSKRFFD